MHNLECVDCGAIVNYQVRVKNPRCYSCRRKRNNQAVKAWKERNKEHVEEYSKKWLATNRELRASQNARYRARAKGYILKDPLIETKTHKQCGDCRLILPKTAFDKYSNHDKLSRKCRSCTKAYHSRYRFKKRLCNTKQ